MLLGALAATASATEITTLPFVDNFDNGDIANSDDIVGAWPTSNPPSNTGGYFTESGGSLHIDMPTADGAQFRFLSTEVSSAFNFFNHQLDVQINDMSFASNGTTQNFFSTRLESNDEGSNTDFLWLRFRSDGQVSLIERVNSTTNNNLYLGADAWEGNLNWVRLVIDGNAVTASWNSSVGGTVSTSVTTTFTEGTYGSNGNSNLELQGQQVSGAANPTDISIGQVYVAVPEPSQSAAMFGMACLLIAGLVRRRMHKS